MTAATDPENPAEPQSDSVKAAPLRRSGGREGRKARPRRSHEVRSSEEAQALDAVREVGPGSHYLGAEHTQRNFETAFWRSATADSNTYEQWSQKGRLDAATRANAIWKRLLRDYEQPPMDSAVAEALRDYRDRRLSEIRMGGQ